MITFIVEGKPQGKARARTFYDKRVGKMRSVTPEQTKSYEDLIRWSYKAAGGQYMGEKTLQVDIQAFYPIPQSFSKAKRNDAIFERIRPTTKPDLDNCAKAVLDALNGVAFYDDSQVVDLTIRKFYGETGYLKITIKEI